MFREKILLLTRVNALIKQAHRKHEKIMLKVLQQIKPTNFFFVAAIFIEFFFNIVTPPLQAPDEFSHFYRAYQIADGHFFPEKIDQRLGGNIPQGIVDFANQYRNSAYIQQYTIDRREVLNSCKIKLQANNQVFQDFANTAYYSAVSYLPQALSLFVLKQFTDNLGVLYYGGRVFTFLIWFLCMLLVIRIMPIYKWLTVGLLLLPMHLYITNSYSADTVTNILSFLFISIVLRHVLITKTITVKHLIVIAGIVGLLVLAKVVYIGLIVMLFIMPSKKFSKKSLRVFWLSGIFLFSFVLMALWSNSIMQFYIPIKDYNPAFRDVASLSPCGDYYAQKAYILSHGFYFINVILRSFFDHPGTYLSGYIGVFGNGDIGMPKGIYVISYIILLLVAIGEKNEFMLTGIQKTCILAAALCASSLLLLSQHLIWDCVGEGVVDLLQGRYLIPVFSLLFMLLDNKIRVLKFNVTFFIIIMVTGLNGSAFVLINHRFFVGSLTEKEEYVCDAEQIDEFGAFKTNHNEIFMQNANCRTEKEHRSGKFSAVISPESPYCFTTKFSNISKGDIFEIEAWEKGNGALIVIDGAKENCGKLYFASTYNSYTDKLGWRRIKNVYRITLKCDSMVIGVYLWNPGKTRVYVDDLNVKVIKPKTSF